MLSKKALRSMHQTRPSQMRNGAASLELSHRCPVAVVPLLMDRALEDRDRDAGQKLVAAVVGP